ncbi:sensor histidine kinase, partial [Klebsiella pneumoniae]|uniref:sensor histidine kinase n=3 Tax=Bacteria TaxID=2 RepID=UPI00279619B3
AFIANLSHELKTPIASLVGVSDLLADEKLDESTRKDLTGILRSESLRLSRLCDGIVTLTKMERDFEPKKKPLQLDEQIRHAVILITEKWKQKEIDLTFTSRPVYCVTDPD